MSRLHPFVDLHSGGPRAGNVRRHRGGCRCDPRRLRAAGRIRGCRVERLRWRFPGITDNTQARECARHHRGLEAAAAAGSEAGASSASALVRLQLTGHGGGLRLSFASHRGGAQSDLRLRGATSSVTHARWPLALLAVQGRIPYDLHLYVDLFYHSVPLLAISLAVLIQLDRHPLAHLKRVRRQTRHGCEPRCVPGTDHPLQDVYDERSARTRPLGREFLLSGRQLISLYARQSGPHSAADAARSALMLVAAYGFVEVIEKLP